MAVSTSVWHSNSIQGVPGIGVDVDIFANHTTPKFAVGQRYTRQDGAEFVYSHFGAAAGTISTGGIVVSTDLSESGTAQAGGRILASGSVTAIAGETITPGTVGSHYVQIIGGGISADEFAGGYFQTCEGDGGLYNYRIKGNTSSSAKTTGAKLTYYVELYETLQQTLATAQNTDFRIVGSLYANLESASAGTDAFIAGVTTASHMATNSYGWVQRKGFAGVRTDASETSTGSAVALSTAEPGLVSGELPRYRNSNSQPGPIIGFCVASAHAGTADQLIGVMLTL